MNIALVTGASSGMGREFVRQLSDYATADEIWAVARRADALEALKGETSIPVRPVCLDLLEEESFRTLGPCWQKKNPISNSLSMPPVLANSVPTTRFLLPMTAG